MTAVLGPLAVVLGLLVMADPSVDFSFADPDITESSGLVISGDLAATINDSGDAARVFTVSRRSGDTVGVTAYAGDAVDVEALAPAGRGRVWVGDIGDNTADRDAIRIVLVPIGPGDQRVEGTAYRLRYPASSGPRDAETLMRDPVSGRLLIVTKQVLGGQVFEVPAHLDPDGVGVLRPVSGPAAVLGLATDGAILPGGRYALIRNYTQAVVYRLDDWSVLESWTLPAQPQGEGVAVSARRLWLSSEGPESEVLTQPLPTEVVRAISAAPHSAGATAGPASSGAPAPGAGGFADGADEGADEGAERSPWPWLAGLGAFGVSIWVLIRAVRAPEDRPR